MARVSILSDKQQAYYGKNGLDGVGPNIQANISEGISYMATSMDNLVLSLTPSGDAHLNLNEDNNNGLKEVNEEVGLFVTQPSKQIAKWTRLSRMEVGLIDLNHSTSKLKLGKRLVEDALDVNCAEGAATLSQKRSKVGFSDGDSDFTSVGVDDHPC